MFFHWTQRALCKSNPDLWWDIKRRREAIHKCLAHCPVLAECRERAFQVRPSSGVMAGFTWTPITNCSAEGRPSRRCHPVACDLCKARARFPCPYCGKHVEGEKAYIVHKIAHPGCKEQYSRELELEEAAQEIEKLRDPSSSLKSNS